MDRLGSAKWLEIFERFRDLKKVEKHWSRGFMEVIKVKICTINGIFKDQFVGIILGKDDCSLQSSLF